MEREHLTSAERSELDDLMYEAGYGSAGKPRPSHEIGPRVAKALRDAAGQARRHWASYILDDILTAGCLVYWRRWNKRRTVIEVAGKTYVTTKAAAIGVRKADAQTGRTYFQATFWSDLTRDELHQVIARAAKQIDSEGKTVALAKRLLGLLDRVPEAKTVAEAAKVLGLTTESYLAAVDAGEDGDKQAA